MASLSNQIVNGLCIAAPEYAVRKRPLFPLLLLVLVSLTACKKAPTEPPRPAVEVLSLIHI